MTQIKKGKTRPTMAHVDLTEMVMAANPVAQATRAVVVAKEVPIVVQLARGYKPPATKKAKPMSRAARWSQACAAAKEALEALEELRGEYESWKDNLPESLQSSPVGEKLETVCELDFQSAIDVVDEAEGADLPQGFGRD